MLDGAFHADVAGTARARDGASGRACWRSSAPSPRARAGLAMPARRRGQQARTRAASPRGALAAGPRRDRLAADARHRQPGLDRLVRLPRARARAHAARRDLAPRCGRRSTRSTSRSSATTCAVALATGPYSVYQDVKERCALFWGLLERTMLRDEGSSFLDAGGRSRWRTWCCGCCASASPRRDRRRGRHARPRGRGARTAAGRRRLPGLPRRGRGSRPTLQPRRALPALRARLSRHRSPPGSTRCGSARDAPTPAPRTSQPVLRLGRLIADLDFQRRRRLERRRSARCCAASRRSSRPIDTTSTSATSRLPRVAAVHSERPALRWRSPMHFAIRYLTRYHYDADVVDNLNALRVKPAAEQPPARATSSTCRLTPRCASTATSTTSAPRWSSSRSPARTGS